MSGNSARIRPEDPETWAGPLVGVLVAGALIWTFVVQPIIQWVQDNAILVILAALAIAILGSLYTYKRITVRRATELQLRAQEAQRAAARREWEQTLAGRITAAVQQFQPSRRYKNEFGYHTELQGWLRREFPSAQVELQTGSSRPDIIVDNIAIEVKGPTDAAALKTLSDKCIRYLSHYQGLVIVLFEPNYGRRLFKEVDSGIKRTFPDQVWLIEK